MGGVSLLGALLMRFQLAVELLNFGAFAGFILVNLSVIRHFYLRGRERRGTAFFTNLVFPLAGALVCTYVWMSLTEKVIRIDPPRAFRHHAKPSSVLPPNVIFMPKRPIRQDASS